MVCPIEDDILEVYSWTACYLCHSFETWLLRYFWWHLTILTLTLQHEPLLCLVHIHRSRWLTYFPLNSCNSQGTQYCIRMRQRSNTQKTCLKWLLSTETTENKKGSKVTQCLLWAECLQHTRLCICKGLSCTGTHSVMVFRMKKASGFHKEEKAIVLSNGTHIHQYSGGQKMCTPTLQEWILINYRTTESKG